ncbi:hypothetical protein G5I_01680 [Acromyrmex echinatior]|uniref:Uncharacterized protein n=1 Tax=Acromyrmex echinatior TaxID=103372 RepID=F4W899_ACREC|nr:hypothetical protein G5I_01680 [Acromyrmex echinatior]
MIQSNLDETLMDIDEHQSQIRKSPLQETLEESSKQTGQIPPAKRCASTPLSDAPTVPQAQISHAKNSGSPQVNQNPGDKIPLRYGTRDMGPFVVYMYPNNRDSTIHPMLINRIIAKVSILDILEIKKIDRGKILIVVKTASVANRFSEPALYRSPQQLDLEILKECIESPKAKVLNVQRLAKV